MKRLVIFGAGGHAKVVADIASSYYEEIFFFANKVSNENCLGYPVSENMEQLEQYIGNVDFFVAIGNAAVRKRITVELERKGARLATLIHPSAIIGKNVRIGKGTVVMAGVVINAESIIGENCILNTAASVDHDCTLMNYVHVAVGTHLCGTVVVGENVWIGAGATVSNNVEICAECMIGAGAVVIRDIKEAGTYVGVPAKRIG